MTCIQVLASKLSTNAKFQTSQNLTSRTFQGFSSTFRHLICFQALSRALKFLFQIQAFSRISQARREPCPKDHVLLQALARTTKRESVPHSEHVPDTHAQRTRLQSSRPPPEPSQQHAAGASRRGGAGPRFYYCRNLLFLSCHWRSRFGFNECCRSETLRPLRPRRCGRLCLAGLPWVWGATGMAMRWV